MPPITFREVEDRRDSSIVAAEIGQEELQVAALPRTGTDGEDGPEIIQEGEIIGSRDKIRRSLGRSSNVRRRSVSGFASISAPQSGGVRTRSSRPPRRPISDHRDLEWDDALSIEQREGIQEVRRLMNQSLLASDERALQILQSLGLTANVAYDQIHASGIHAFSKASERPHPFARDFSIEGGINANSVILEAGAGYGRDSAYFAKIGAKVISLDSSRRAVEANLRSVKEKQYAKNMAVVHGDMRDFLLDPRVDEVLPSEFLERNRVFFPEGSRLGNVLTHIYMNSSAHYYPPRVWSEGVLPGLSQLLEEKDGVLGVSIKTDQSASADPSRHYSLTQGDGYNARLDKVDLILRTYPETRTIIRDFSDALRDLRYRIVRERGYDVEGEEEEFAQLIGRPEYAHEFEL